MLILVQRHAPARRLRPAGRPPYDAPSDMTACLLIHNPASRHGGGPRPPHEIIDVVRAAGWRFEVAVTERDGHATELARDAAARGIDVVVVHGGDGTVNEAVNGIAGSATALGVIPAGTANVWAKEIGMPRFAGTAMQAIVRGERRRIDLGRAGPRYFLLMAGVGLDAAIVPHVNPWLKRRLGVLAYLLAGAITALRTKPWHASLRIDGTARRGPVYWLLAGNTRSYGGLVDVTYRARADDGLLDVAIMRRGGAFHLLVDGIRLLRRRHDRSPNVDYVRARTVDIEMAGLPVQLDGELAGRTPLRIKSVPDALTVIVPAGLRSPLFSEQRVSAPA